MEDKKSFNKSDNESNSAYKLKIKNKLKSCQSLKIVDNDNNSNHKNYSSSSDFSYEDNELNRKKKMMKINIIKSN